MSTQPSRGRFRSAAILAAAAGLIAPAAASAGPGGLSYVTKQQASHPGDIAMAEAECPEGEDVMGGGVWAIGGYGRQHLHTTTLWGSEAGIDSWLGRVVNRTSKPSRAAPKVKPIPFRTTVICGESIAAGGLDAGEIQPGTLGDLWGGGCPGGTSISGGGILLGGTEETRVTQTYPLQDDGWFASAYNPGANHPAYAAVRVVCAAGTFSYPMKTKTVGPHEQGRVQQRCPNGTHVTGGGVWVDGDKKTAYVNSSYPRDLNDADSAPDDAWRAHVDNLASSSRDIAVRAICRG